VTIQPYYQSSHSGEKRTALEFFIRYLESRGKARILSAPNLILERGYEGNIITGEELPIVSQTVVSGSISTSTQFKSVGIKLKVLPVMIIGDTVRLQVSPEVSTVTGYTEAGAGLVSNPVIAVRNASTELKVKDGEIISIGGLYKNEERTVSRRVPVLGSLPGVGHLFRGTWEQKVRTQIIIFLSIRILPEDRGQEPFIHRPDENAPAIQQEIDRMEKSLKLPKTSLQDDLERLRNDGRE
ncbi:MAG: type II and III secretion system protein, partial [Planctomycetota bacterium]